MIDDHSPFDWAEHLQEDPEDISFRRKVWTVSACAFVGLWIALAGVIAVVM